MGLKDKNLVQMVYQADLMVGAVRLNIKVHVMEGMKSILVDFELRIHMLDLLDDIPDMELELDHHISFYHQPKLLGSVSKVLTFAFDIVYMPSYFVVHASLYHEQKSFLDPFHPLLLVKAV